MCRHAGAELETALLCDDLALAAAFDVGGVKLTPTAKIFPRMLNGGSDIGARSGKETPTA